MTYNPSVNDRSGEILAGYQTNAANASAQGAMALGESLQSVGNSMTDAIAKSQANTAKLQGIQSTGSAMQAILPQYGDEGILLGQALQTELGKAGNNADKMGGTIMAFMPAIEGLITRFNTKNQYNQARILANQKAALAGGGGGSNPFYSVELGDGIDMNQ
jgi:phage-related protein